MSDRDTNVKNESKRERPIRKTRSSFRAGPLAIPSDVKDPTMHYVWELDNPAAISRRLEVGYRACTSNAIRAVAGDRTINEDSNTRDRQIVRTGNDGQRLVLMEIDREIFEEIKAELAVLAQENEDQTQADALRPGTYGHRMDITSQTYEDN